MSDMIHDICLVRDFWSGVRLTAVIFLMIYTPFGVFFGLTVN